MLLRAAGGGVLKAIHDLLYGIVQKALRNLQVGAVQAACRGSQQLPGMPQALLSRPITFVLEVPSSSEVSPRTYTTAGDCRHPETRPAGGRGGRSACLWGTDREQQEGAVAVEGADGHRSIPERL